MPAPTSILLRIRRRRHQSRRTSARPLNIAAALVAMVTLIVGALFALAAGVYVQLVNVLPPAEEVEHYFGSGADPHFVPARFFDHSRKHLLFELSNPQASDRQWVAVAGESQQRLPDYVVDAAVAYHEPDYWRKVGFDWRRPGELLAGAIAPAGQGAPELTLTERLAESTLLPVDFLGGQGVRRGLALALLADRLRQAYTREQVLTWYFNSAHYGRYAYGIDAAALVYFGKHADELTLAEAAILAPIPGAPELNPIDQPGAARRRQRVALEAMVRLGMISRVEASQAQQERLQLAQPGPVLNPQYLPLAELAADQLQKILRPGFERRGGWAVRTSIDLELQGQVDCALRAHLARLSGEPGQATSAVTPREACVSARLLPPLRPADTGVDHEVTSAAAIVLDPTEGTLLALVASPSEFGADLAINKRPIGEAFYPFIYLTAFSRGFAPGTMVLDVPATMANEDLSGPQELGRGPVRMRVALANGLPYAAVQAAEMAGRENVAQTASRFGLTAVVHGLEARLSGQASLLEAAQSYGVLANDGVWVGDARPEAGGDGLQAGLILEVEDLRGRRVYAYEAMRRTVLSQPLAFLVNDVLSDGSARDSSGADPLLDVGRPAGAVAAAPAEGADSLAVGYTPQRVIAVWLGNPNGEPMRGVDRLNGALPVWHVLMRHVSQALQPEGWSPPAGVTQLEVCDPSGLLPTEACPRVVREYFLQGTEPASADPLFRSYEINRETGKLATLFTPLELVEERVIFVPPPEAQTWADRVGLERPPAEYDPVPDQLNEDPAVRILAPEPFDLLSGLVAIRGDAHPEAFEYYRVQYGSGLNPHRWIQIGDDIGERAWGGRLGQWDTSGLSGLFTLQLVVVTEDDKIRWAAVPVTLDNERPNADVLVPETGSYLSASEAESFRVLVSAEDNFNVERVRLYLDGRLARVLQRPPYALALQWPALGKHVLEVQAVDGAGNQSERAEVVFWILP